MGEFNNVGDHEAATFAVVGEVVLMEVRKLIQKQEANVRRS